jgi:hypothetical protein
MISTVFFIWGNEKEAVVWKENYSGFAQIFKVRQAPYIALLAIDMKRW